MSNLEDVAKFVQFQSINRRAGNTLKKYAARLKSFAQFLNKPWKEATREDVAHALTLMQEAKKPNGLPRYAENTLRDTRVVLRLFYSWLFECKNDEHPPAVSWIEAGNAVRKTVLRDEVITAADLNKILAATPHERNKALIAILWATGARADEALNIRLGDFENIAGIEGVNLRGTKTKLSKRWAAIADAKVEEVLKAWMAMHPDRANPNAPLWINSSGERISYQMLNRVLRESHKRAGVIKPPNPHHYRHSWASRKAIEYKYETFCRQGGWTLNSAEARSYVHRDKQDDAESIATTLTDEKSKMAVVKEEAAQLLLEFFRNNEGVMEAWKSFLASKSDIKTTVKLAKEVLNTQKTNLGAFTKKEMLQPNNRKKVNAPTQSKEGQAG